MEWLKKPVKELLYVDTYYIVDCVLLGFDVCSLVDVYQRFGGTYIIHLQGKRVDS